VSQIVHKFRPQSHKCQTRGEKQTDKFLQREGSANDYFLECVKRDRERERERENNAQGVLKRTKNRGVGEVVGGCV